MLTLADVAKAKRLNTLGILIPVRCVLAAKKTGLPLHLAASVLVQESGGGRNVFGHDPTIFRGGQVNQRSYAAYKKARVASGNRLMQGVGPCQLTYWTYQDKADALGGCWKPLPNMLVGFGLLADLVRRDGLHAGVKAYNGSGAAADLYADAVLKRADWFAQGLA